MPPAPCLTAGLLVCVFLFLSYSAEMCAGSLVSGCWFPDHFCFRITLILETDIVTFGAQNHSFGMPGASTLAPWGTMARSRGTWGLKKEDLGVQAQIFIDFGLISGPHFASFSGPLDKNRFFFEFLC